MKKTFILLPFIFLIFFNVSFASKADEKILQKKLFGFTNLTSEFKQIVFSESGQKLQESSGKMAIQRPGKFYFNTLEPQKQIIIANGKKVWVYDPDLSQVTIRFLDNSIGQTPVLLLTSSDIYLSKSFYVTKLQTKENIEWFKLIPKNKNEAFSSIILGFKNNEIAQMKLSNQLGQNTILYFSNIIMNQTINHQLFNFNVPSDVDVIDETKGLYN